MDQPLPFDAVESEGALTTRIDTSRPFTRAMLRDAGIDDLTCTKLVRSGAVRRLLRGVYVDPFVIDSPSLRSAALRLLLPPEAIVVDRTAAWLHGVRLPGQEPSAAGPLQQVRVGAGRARPPRRLVARDIGEVHGVRVTTPLRTALDLGRTLPTPAALAAIDGLLRAGGQGVPHLLGELPRFTSTPGAAQLRVLIAQADPRAVCPAESVLRLCWHEGALPTPIPGLAVTLGERCCRLSLGVPLHQFAVSVTGQLTRPEIDVVTRSGWHLVLLPARRVEDGDPRSLRRMLEAEYYQQLLRLAGCADRAG